jgi:Domain of unknown function (DUF4342)
MSAHTHQEEFRLNGEQLLAKVKELINQGNVRRIIVKNKDGKTLIEVPLTYGVAGAAALALFAPALAAIGAVAALVTECSLIVERDDAAPSSSGASSATTDSADPALLAKSDDSAAT